MINGDRSTQTDFDKNKGMTINHNMFREGYEKTLASGKWHLEGGIVKHFGSWRQPPTMTKQTQTMKLEMKNKIMSSEN